MFGIAPPSTDYFMNTLASILGPIVPHVTGIGGNDGTADTATALSVLLGYFNTVVLFVATAWLLYIGFVGLLKTAHEGEWLGQKWNTMLIPLRIAIAVAMVLPVFPAGSTGASYSAVQAIIVWVEGNAVGIADDAWGLAAQYIVKDPIGGVSLGAGHSQKIVDDIFMDEVCMDAVNRSANASDTGANGGANQNPISEHQFPASSVGQKIGNAVDGIANIGDDIWYGQSYHPYGVTDQQISWGGQPGLLAHWGMSLSGPSCGAITFPSAASGTNTTSQVDTAVWSVSSAQIQSLVSTLAPLAQDVVTNRTVPSDSQYQGIIENFENGVVSGSMPSIANAEKPAEQKFLNGVNQQGFATAGVWWWELTHLNETAQNAMNSIGTGTLWNPDILKNGAVGGANAARPMHRAAVFLQNYLAANKPGPDGAPESGVPQHGGISGMLTYVSKSAGNVALWAADEGRNQNPILGLAHIGTIFVTLGMADIAAPTIAKGIAAISDASAIAQLGADPANDVEAVGANVVASKISSWASKGIGLFLGLALLGIGIVLSVWIPMIPFIIWTFAIFGLLIFFVEAVFAGPFWAIGHMNPDGHEVVGSGSRGWMNILQLVLKPVLMVGGLIAGTAILYAGAWMVQHTIGGAIIDTFENSAMGFVGLLDAIAEAVIYVFMLIVLIDLSFGLVHKLPDLVFAWIGGGGTDRGEIDMHGKEQNNRSKFGQNMESQVKNAGNNLLG